MNDRPGYSRPVQILLRVVILAGLAASALSVTADWLGLGGQAGFGRNQTLLLLGGLCASLLGWGFLRFPQSRGSLPGMWKGWWSFCFQRSKEWAHGLWKHCGWLRRSPQVVIATIILGGFAFLAGTLYFRDARDYLRDVVPAELTEETASGFDIPLAALTPTGVSNSVERLDQPQPQLRVTTDSSSYGYQLQSSAVPLKPHRFYLVQVRASLVRGGMGIGVLSSDQKRWLGMRCLDPTSAEPSAFNMPFFSGTNRTGFLVVTNCLPAPGQSVFEISSVRWRGPSSLGATVATYVRYRQVPILLLAAGLSLVVASWLVKFNPAALQRTGLPRVASLEKVEAVRWLVFLACLLTLGTNSLRTVLTDSSRFEDVEEADWNITNAWIASANCARQTGAWLAVCNEGRLYARGGDDPGHAFFLGMFSRLTNTEVTLADVIRLNAWLAFVGFATLAALLFAMRSYVTWLVLLLAGGPIVFWVVPRDSRYYSLLAPHPSLVGAVAMTAILPIATVAHLRGWIPRRLSPFLVSLGLICLGIASLVRQATGMMGLLVTLCVLVAVSCLGPRNTRRLMSLAGLGLLTVIAWMTPRWVFLARDLSFPVEPATQLQVHGMSHSLYIGLGAVDNRFGIEWRDGNAREAVKEVAPQVAYVSPEYYRILWRLYFAKVREDPGEVMRIYLAKASLLLDRDISQLWVRGRWRPYGWVPLLWRVLVGLIVPLAIATIFGLWRRYRFEHGFFLGIITLMFVALFIIQAALIHPSLVYAAPIGLFVLLLAGIALELLCRSLLIQPAK